MTSLTGILLAPERRAAVIDDCVALIEEHVHGRHGFKGMALKTGLAMLHKARPGILARATERFVPEFALALQPLFEEFTALRSTGAAPDFGSFLEQNLVRTRRALLEAADRRVAQSPSATVHTNYRRFRGMAEDELALAMPAIATLFRRHIRA